MIFKARTCSTKRSFIFISINNTTNRGTESSAYEKREITLALNKLTLTYKIRFRQLSAKAFRV